MTLISLMYCSPKCQSLLNSCNALKINSSQHVLFYTLKPHCSCEPNDEFLFHRFGFRDLTYKYIYIFCDYCIC